VDKVAGVDGADLPQQSEQNSAQTVAPAGAGRAMWEIFTSPSIAFERQVARPAWGLPLVAGASLLALSHLYVLLRVGLTRLFADTLRAIGTIDTQGALRAMLANRDTILVGQVAAMFVGSIIMVFVVWLLLWLACVSLGIQLKLRSLLAVVSLSAFFYSALTGLLECAVVTVTPRPELLNPGNLLATNLGFFFHPASPALRSAMQSLDLLSIATIGMLVLGIRIVGKASLGRATLAVCVPWALYVLRGYAILAVS
jgi:hypothetical protein